jgi:hypothetical protein
MTTTFEAIAKLIAALSVVLKLEKRKDEQSKTWRKAADNYAKLRKDAIKTSWNQTYDLQRFFPLQDNIDKIAIELAKPWCEFFKVKPQNGWTIDNLINAKFALMSVGKSDFRVWFDNILNQPQLFKEQRQVYGYNTLRFAMPQPVHQKNIVVEVPEVVVSTAQPPISTEVMQAVAKVQDVVQEAKQQLKQPVLFTGRKEHPVQFNTLDAILEVFNDFEETDDEIVSAQAGHLNLSDVGGSPPIEPITEEPEDDGTTVDEEEPKQSLVAIQVSKDKKVLPKVSGWMVDHVIPDLVGHPQLAVVHTNLPAQLLLSTVKSGLKLPSWVDVVMADSPDGAILKVETGGGALFVALMQNGQLIALPALGGKKLQHLQPNRYIKGPDGPGSVFAPFLRRAGGGNGGSWEKNVQSGNDTLPAMPTGNGEQLQRIEEDKIVAEFQQLTLRPKGLGSVHKKRRTARKVFQQKRVHFEDEHTQPVGNVLSSSFGGGKPPTLKHKSPSVLGSSLAFGSMECSNCLDGSPDGQIRQRDDGMHSQLVGNETETEGYGSNAKDALAQLVQIQSTMVDHYTGHNAGKKMPINQPNNKQGNATVDSDGFTTVEEWLRGESPTGYGRLEDSDDGVGSPFGCTGSALAAGCSWSSCGSGAIGYGGNGFPSDALGVAWAEGDTFVC